MNSNDIAPMVISVVLFFSVGAVLILRGPVGRAWARRIEGGSAGPELEGRLVEMESRLQQLEQERTELHERIDFAERMLAQRESPRELSP